MSAELERDLGEQPIAALLRELDLKSHDLVAASTEQMTGSVNTVAAILSKAG